MSLELLAVLLLLLNELLDRGIHQWRFGRILQIHVVLFVFIFTLWLAVAQGGCRIGVTSLLSLSVAAWCHELMVYVFSLEYWLLLLLLVVVAITTDEVIDLDHYLIWRCDNALFLNFIGLIEVG